MLKQFSERLMIIITLFLVVNSCKAFETRIGPGVAGQIHAIAYDIRYPDRVYVGADVSGVYRSTDGGDNWHQIQSNQSGGGWESRGINMMGVTDLAVDQNGLLAVASNDYGAFQSTDISNDHFKWLNCERYQHNSVDDDEMKMTDIECLGDSIYATLGVSDNDYDRNCRSKIVVYKDCSSGDPYDEIGYWLDEEYYQQRSGTIAYWVKDIEIINEELWFISTQWRDVGTPP